MLSEFFYHDNSGRRKFAVFDSLILQSVATNQHKFSKKWENYLIDLTNESIPVPGNLILAPCK